MWWCNRASRMSSTVMRDVSVTSAKVLLNLVAKVVKLKRTIEANLSEMVHGG